MAKKTVNKSAATGKIVSKDFADKNPDTTFTQKVSEKVSDAVDAVKHVFEPKKVKAKKAPSKDAPKVALKPDVIVAKFEPQLDIDYLFNDAFIGHIISFDPFVIIKQSILNGVVSDTPIEGTKITDYVIAPLSREEYFRRLG